MKLLTALDRMKRSSEQRTMQQQVAELQTKVNAITQRIQPVQDEACQLFEEIDAQGSQLENSFEEVERCIQESITEKIM